MTFTAYDEFAGFGGSSQGLHAVPGLDIVLAANHAELAVEVHALNFPDADHYLGDVTEADLTKFRRVDFFWASPACPPWSNARGKRRDFDKSTQAQLFDYLSPEELAEAESLNARRALMEEIPRYLSAISLRGKPVLAGVVENVVEVTHWDQFARWRREIENSDGGGYKTKIIALNSMHAQGRKTLRAPQSRNRFYMAFWHRSLGRDPDWNKWLRPRAWCPVCETEVDAVQQFKKPGAWMGSYRSQYVYVCPRLHRGGRPVVVEPYFVPAAAAIDWSLAGERIGDREKPLADKTRARIAAGIRKHARPVHVEAGGNQYDSLDPRHPRHGHPDGYVRAWPVDADPLRTLHTTATKGVAVPPMLSPAGGSWNESAQTVDEAMRTRTTRESDGLLVPPLAVPVEGRDGKVASPLDGPMRTQTARHETAIAVPPMVMSHRDFAGAHERRTRPVDTGALPTVAASGNHASVVVPPMVVRHFGHRGGPDANGYLSTTTDRVLGALTASGHQSVVVPPFIAELRGGGSKHRAVTEALATVTASGNHHGLVTPAATMAAWAALYAYDTGALYDHQRVPLPTQTTVEGDALLAGDLPDVDDCLFRMLAPHEIGRGMAFFDDFKVLGSKRLIVRGYGNAVTPPVSEVLGCALMECMSGEEIPA